jgi:hypothetical protein
MITAQLEFTSQNKKETFITGPCTIASATMLYCYAIHLKEYDHTYNIRMIPNKLLTQAFTQQLVLKTTPKFQEITFQ